MKNRVGIVLTLALVTGGLAAYLAFTVLREPDVGAVQAAEVDLVDVVVAARDLDVGSVLTREDVQIVRWPATALPAGFSRSPAEVVDRGLLTSVAENEPLLSRKLARREAGGGLPILIPEGKRAMSVEVDDVVGVAGFVLPGTRVDVLVTLDQQARQEEPRARMILQNVDVAAAGQTTERDAQGRPKEVSVVTLIVDPAQGEKLALASAKGRLQLALRNSLDLEQVETEGVLARELLADTRPARRQVVQYRPPRPTRFNVEVYRGPERSTSTVEKGKSSEGDGEDGS